MGKKFVVHISSITNNYYYVFENEIAAIGLAASCELNYQDEYVVVVETTTQEQVYYRDYTGKEIQIEMISLPDFAIGKYPVTQKQWRKIMGTNPSYFSDCDDCPVENVSWHDIQDFLKKLNSLTGKRYRLPTEAEWEYAARAGTDWKFAGCNTAEELGDYAWYGENSEGRTRPVGQKKPNQFGLYDMTGNVWEWCQDENSHIIRGGCWFSTAEYCRAADRFSYTPTNRYYRVGFRLVLEV